MRIETLHNGDIVELMVSGAEASLIENHGFRGILNPRKKQMKQIARSYDSVTRPARYPIEELRNIANNMAEKAASFDKRGQPAAANVARPAAAIISFLLDQPLPPSPVDIEIPERLPEKGEVIMSLPLKELPRLQGTGLPDTPPPTDQR